MGKDELIDAHVSLKQCKLAVEALHAHSTKAAEKQRETELLPGKEHNIWLNVTVKKIASAHKFKPVKIPIVHPLVDPRTSPVCLITKDPQRQYKDLLAENNIKFISRVVGIEKLKGKFKPFEARRMLLKENGLFLADERVVPLLPKLLGSKWFEAKKQPIPVCLTRKDLKGELERAISSTYMNQNQGTCTAIKISIVSHKPSQVLENLQAALPVIIKSIKGGWDNVQSLLLKTNSSAGLPIWSCDLGDGQGGRWEGLVAAADDETSSLDADDEMDVVTEKGARKGKKRAVAEEETEAEEPKKKAKGANGKALTTPTGKTAPSPGKAGNAVPGDSNAPAKSKKRKASLGADVIPPTQSTPPVSAAAESKDSAARKSKASVHDAAKITAADADATLSKSKKKSKSRTEDVAEAPSQPVAAEQKKAKAGKTASSDVRVSEPESTPASKKKRSKAEKSELSTVTAAPPSASPSDAPEGKKIKGILKSAKVAAPSLTNEELKQKRVGKAGEKKKEKVAKGKSGKSAKDGIIGKKAAQ
ncbi:ribosomal protein L1p/L10e family-domain-containing protein [Mycena epipterygia]|nr:ribosomal protein L1p/L10e family-domain-containing protein [Mycena epipterygia]